MSDLVRPLREGPLDIIGDVHGERVALESLLDKLRYDPMGNRVADRPLVFVGDLTDRGPDSPGVIRIVQQLVDAGRAQIVAGNHELNLLRGERKHGNHWFFGQTSDPNHPEFGQCVAASEVERKDVEAFFKTLPIALENDSLRVVHAAWIEEVVHRCRAIHETVDIAYAEFERAFRDSEGFRRVEELYHEEVQKLGKDAFNALSPKPGAIHAGAYDEAFQNGNPVRVLTSGLERATSEPFRAAGKWRFVKRVPWWREYTGPVPVIFGHYWRWWDPSVHDKLSKGEPQMFADDPVGVQMKPEDRAFCIDFSVGSRFKQRDKKHAPPYHGRLAALRWPERELVFDDHDPPGYPE